MKRFDAVLFDLGNTLFYFDGNMPQVLQESSRALAYFLAGVYPDLDAVAFLSEFEARMQAYYAEREHEFIEYTIGYILHSLLAEGGYTEIPDTLADQALEAMHRVSQAHWILEDDAFSTLALLQQRGYRLGAISNVADERSAQALVDKGNIRPYFDVIVTSAGLGVRKPNPRIFQAALNHWGIPAGRVAMVGDTLGADILGARNTGMFSIWLTRRANTPGNHNHLDTIRPDAVIARLSELPDLLK